VSESQIVKNEFYRAVLAELQSSGIPFLIGGGHALARYTGIKRDTKDLDLFVLREDCPRLLAHMAARGFTTDFTFPHWLGKILGEGLLVDVIFSSGNGLCEVDREWFSRSEPAELLGFEVRLIPAEEMIWSKGFIMERHRFDGADIAHLIHARADRLDWNRLVGRFGRHWPVLLAHMILFRFVYPSEAGDIPDGVLSELLERANQGARRPRERLCQGTFLSLLEYLTDVREWGYEDARSATGGPMTPEQVADYTRPFLNPPA
jgi:hypothetical protein